MATRDKRPADAFLDSDTDAHGYQPFEQNKAPKSDKGKGGAQSSSDFSQTSTDIKACLDNVTQDFKNALASLVDSFYNKIGEMRPAQTDTTDVPVLMQDAAAESKIELPVNVKQYVAKVFSDFKADCDKHYRNLAIISRLAEE